MAMAGPLPNLRWERFAREYASGETLAAAYVRAGYCDSRNAKFNASRLSHKGPVRGRINELMEQFAEQAAVKVEYLQHQLLPALRTNPQDLFDDNGKLKPIAELQRDCAAAIKSIKFDKQTGHVSEIVLADKIAAAGILLRSIGGLVDRSELSGPNGEPLQVESGPRSDLDVARRIAFLLHTASGNNEPARVAVMAAGGRAENHSESEGFASSEIKDFDGTETPARRDGHGMDGRR